MGNNYKFISLFSGAMGLDLGLEQAGWEGVLALDNDKMACETVRANIQSLSNPEIKIVEDDIRNYTAQNLVRLSGTQKKDIFAIVGGPPCQAFSSAGKRLGLSDERGNVFITFLEIIDDIKPPFVVIENVRGMLSTKIEDNPEMRYPITVSDNLLTTKHGLMLLIIEQLENMGYTISFTLYNTANYGVPQQRERVIIIGHKGKTKVPLIPPSHFHDQEPHWRTFRDAVQDLSTKEMTYLAFPESRLKYYRLLKEGQHWRSLPHQLQKEALGNSYHLGGGKTGFLRRLAWDKPSPTLITSPLSFPATDLCHPEELRPLSIEEYARIQQFPDNWQFMGNTKAIYKQIGNAVPVGFGRAIGKHIINFKNNIRKYASRKEVNNDGIRYSRYRNTDHKYYESIYLQESNQMKISL